MTPLTAVCPTCGSGSLKAFDRARYHDSSLRFDICGDCNLVFMNPHPTLAWYDRLNSGEFWEVKSLRQSGSTVNRNLSMWQISLKRSKKLARFLERDGFAPPTCRQNLFTESACPSRDRALVLSTTVTSGRSWARREIARWLSRNSWSQDNCPIASSKCSARLT